MELEYIRGSQREMPKRTIWCVEIKSEGGAGMPMHLQGSASDLVVDRRIFSNNNNARKWIEYAKRQPDIWFDNSVVNCFELPLDWWGWARDPAQGATVHHDP